MENEKRNRNRSLLSGFALTHENWLHWHYVASHMDMEHTLVDRESAESDLVGYTNLVGQHLFGIQKGRIVICARTATAGKWIVIRSGQQQIMQVLSLLCADVSQLERRNRKREGSERDSTCLNNEQWIRAIVNQSQTNQPTFVMVAAFISRVPVSVAKAACSCCMKSCSRRRVRARSIISSRFPAAVGSMLKP